MQTVIGTLIVFLFYSASLFAERVNIDKKSSNTHHVSEVFILGTKHLSGMKGKYEVSILTNLVNRLEAFEPDLIAIEALPPTEVQSMQAFIAEHGNVLSSYGRFQTRHSYAAQHASQLSYNTAMKKLESGSADCLDKASWQDCILTYLAAYDYYSALLIWSQAEPTARADFAKQHKVIADDFDKRLTSTNEYVSIAIALGNRLNHKRLYPVDSHSEKGPLTRHFEQPQAKKDVEMAMSGLDAGHPYLAKMDELWKTHADQGNVLPFYRWLNSAEAMQGDIDFQWTPWLEKDGLSGIGHARVSWWEYRNINMVSHLLNVIAKNQGKRLIYIVGASHKSYLEKYLRQIETIKLIDAEHVL